MKTALLLGLILCIGTIPARAQELASEDAVRSTVKSFFDALREKDEDGLKGALAPGSLTFNQRCISA